MRIEKKTLNDALRVLGKMVCQTSPVELYRSIHFAGDEEGIHVMATDGVEAVEVAVTAEKIQPSPDWIRRGFYLQKYLFINSV